MKAGIVAAFASGALFGLGLAVSGMTDRTVVLGFLDPLGDFDPTLAFVMAGAVAVTAFAFRYVLRLPRPLFDHSFRLPVADAIDQPLLAGAAIFGIGWGLAGFCPGPALVGLAGGLTDAWIFVPAMLAGSFLHWLLQRAGAGGRT
ncbi:MAG TPA: DUF6691 family protein [Steroidobacteraceae bacterium]|nr:DUF6691 family protein [Steroidobacteraceae bacterium]